MSIAKKVIKGLGIAVLLFAAWMWSRDDRVYMCRPGDVGDCKAAQFGSFSDDFLCQQAAEAFCFDNHYRYGNKAGFACVHHGEVVVTAHCKETEIEVRPRWGAPSTTKYR